MDTIIDRLVEADVGVEELFHSEGIDSVEIFVELDDRDFQRLQLKTKLIKAIQRVQKELLTNPIIEELFEDEEQETKDVNTTNDSLNNQEEQESDSESDGNIAVDTTGQMNPYKGIRLEKEINIDRVFKRTPEGRTLMGLLKQNKKVDDKLLNQIQAILCNFLQANFGMRPSAFQKNLAAISLVQSYPSLRAVTSDIPQALWFHPHGRGKHRHSGRLNYHMEYLVRISSDRIINRSQHDLVGTQPATVTESDEVNDTAVDMEDLINELKFICPGPSTRKHAEELWLQTFSNRNSFRDSGEFHLYLQDNPVATSFNGELLALDFQKLHPQAPEFWVKFKTLQSKVLATFPDLLPLVDNDTVRALSIMRLKNPSRGVKRVRDADSSKGNPLTGIVEWIQVEDPIPMTNSDVPILYMRGKFPEDNSSGVIMWRNCAVPMEHHFRYCFEKLCQAMVVFKASGQASDKQFFVFIMATFMSINHLMSTGEKFMRNLY